MTKIITGAAGLVATVALVGATAFAQFTTSVTASNVVFATGTAALKVAAPGVPATDSLNFSLFPGLQLDEFIPGDEEQAAFFLINEGDVTLDLSLRLTTASGHWSELNNVMKVRLFKGETAPTGENEYHTLAEWNAVNGIALTETIAPTPVGGQGDTWTVQIKLDESADDTAKNKSVTTNWVLTGTQVE